MMMDSTLRADEKSAFDREFEIYLEIRNRFNGSPADISDQEERMLSDSYAEARERMIKTRVANIEDFRTKFETMFAEGPAIPRNESIAELFRDLCFLTNHAPSRAFDAKTWLKWFERNHGGWIERDGEIILMWPENDNMDDMLFELNAAEGREAVYSLIRRRQKAQEAQSC